LWLHKALRPPIDPATVTEETLRGVQAMLDRFRERLGIPKTATRPGRAPDLVDAGVAVILEERPPVFSTALGALEPRLAEECRRRGIKVMAMVSTVEDARTAAADGADVIVAQGGEAGGHRSVDGKPASPEAATVGLMALLPQVVDAVRVPVVAAGGIADGRGLAAALALGASGVLMGTRFVATRESMAPDFWKRRIVESPSDATIVTTAFTGLPARVLRSRFADDYGVSGAPVLPGLLQAGLEQDIWAAAARAGNPAYMP